MLAPATSSGLSVSSENIYIKVKNEDCKNSTFLLSTFVTIKHNIYVNLWKFFMLTNQLFSVPEWYQIEVYELLNAKGKTFSDRWWPNLEQMAKKSIPIYRFVQVGQSKTFTGDITNSYSTICF